MLLPSHSKWYIVNIKTELIRANLKAGVEETFTVFKSKTEANIMSFRNSAYFLGSAYPLTVNHFTIKDGVVTFSDENREFLKTEFCTMYIENVAAV